MWLFWWTIVEPLLRAHRARVLVEIGSEAGKNLTNLVQFAIGADGRVHAIDPKPLFDVSDWVTRAAGRLTVHRDTSLRVLPTLEAADAIFVDGDHNWYTVFHELKAIESRHAALGRPFPLVLLHDVGWPWGRRDLYYDALSIPAEFRLPNVAPDPAAFSAPSKSPVHLDFRQATVEGGPRNGVLTAVEDFVRAAAEPIDLIVIPGFSGLGILVARAARAANAELDAVLKDFTMSPRLAAYLEFLEAGRLRRPIRIQSSTAAPSAAQKPG